MIPGRNVFRPLLPSEPGRPGGGDSGVLDDRVTGGTFNIENRDLGGTGLLQSYSGVTIDTLVSAIGTGVSTIAATNYSGSAFTLDGSGGGGNISVGGLTTYTGGLTLRFADIANLMLGNLAPTGGASPDRQNPGFADGRQYRPTTTYTATLDAHGAMSVGVSTPEISP